ncbi:MAG TPA: hypothetical protein VE553_03865 [Candidatus Binatia bacterium]|nr:hypothetical protein [Candidatus Binatia bacterium]
MRSLAGWLRWWGAPLVGIAASLLPVIAITLLSPTWYIAAPLEEVSRIAPSLAQLIGEVGTVLSQGLVLQLLIAMVILGAIGAGMVALSFLVAPLRRWIAQG